MNAPTIRVRMVEHASTLKGATNARAQKAMREKIAIKVINEPINTRLGKIIFYHGLLRGRPLFQWIKSWLSVMSKWETAYGNMRIGADRS